MKNFQPCPTCGHRHTHRVHRPLWMRLFRKSIALECERCGRVFMVRSKTPEDHRGAV